MPYLRSLVNITVVVAVVVVVPPPQGWPVVMLYPEVEVQPGGKPAVGVVVVPPPQGWPVVILYPEVEVQPSGKLVMGVPATEKVAEIVWLLVILLKV